jgi:AraC-like DNA-binding protein
VFPRRGFFVRRGARGDAAADAAGVLFFTRDEPYRVEHPVDGGDDCTAMVVDDATLLEALGRRVPAAADRPSAPFPVPWAPTSTRTVAALHALRLALATRHPDAIALDEACHDVLSLVVDDLAAHVGRPRTALRAVTVAEHRERVDAARSFLARRHADPLRLADVAREAACSPFHLTRLFRAHVGVPLHRHLRRLRLRAAMDRLASGETNLAAVAVAVGFASHSHFTDAFRRELGVPPSAWRALGRSAREMRKILEA